MEIKFVLICEFVVIRNIWKFKKIIFNENKVIFVKSLGS